MLPSKNSPLVGATLMFPLPSTHVVEFRKAGGFHEEFWVSVTSNDLLSVPTLRSDT